MERNELGRQRHKKKQNKKVVLTKDIHFNYQDRFVAVCVPYWMREFIWLENLKVARITLYIIKFLFNELSLFLKLGSFWIWWFIFSALR